MTIVLNHKKLLGFRLLNAAPSGKVGVKAGVKVGVKVGVKAGVKAN